METSNIKCLWQSRRSTEEVYSAGWEWTGKTRLHESWNRSSATRKGSVQVMVATKEAGSEAGVVHTPCLVSMPPFPALRRYLRPAWLQTILIEGSLTEDMGQFFTGGEFVPIRGNDLIFVLRKVSMTLFFEGPTPPNNTTLEREPAFSVHQ